MAPSARDSAAIGSPQPGMPGEADLDVLDPYPAQDRDAVPLVDAAVGEVVAHRLQPHQRELVLARLGLLEGQHVDVVALEELLHSIDPGPQ